ncbi:uncharacterized protein LOC124421747 isoform X1 [Vespa crabro]|uniref:uncharacterized protein LOC124421747 isoform X1 n=3 Tax=Vespa crabro TaxID=7445 RepID=UPI001F022C7C|nr:uncharacterized protein LOC124421747 isoform X1 [Vespa crabro]
MSINVTVSGNPINIRRGRVVLSDLDQIKKNERDRRRRLRLEQVRQQSKEISNRLLERAKNIAQQELDKLEKDEKSELKRLHERKIMEIQQRYQEDMENIGQAHLNAILESEAIADIEDETERNREIALKRGKEALEQLKKVEKDDQHTMHRQRLQQIRELENKRSSLVAELSRKTASQDESCRNLSQENRTSLQQDKTNDNSSKSVKKKKIKRLVSTKSPAKKTRNIEKVNEESQESDSPLQLSPREKIHVQNEVSQKCITTTKSDKKSENTDNIVHTNYIAQDDKSPRQTVPILSISAKAQKLARYNPGDYVQDSSDLMSNESPSLSDDSSYFSDVCEQSTCIRTPKHHTSFRDSKVQLYDHTTRQRNNYNRPLDVVERLDIRNEPNAVDAAREVERTESVESHVTETHKFASQKRGDDAILREKVRSDYQTLMKSLDHLSSEERKLKASDIQCDPMNDVQLRKSRRRELQKEQKKKLNRKFEAMTDKSCCASHCPNLMERVITLEPVKQFENHDKKAEGTWKEPHFVDDHVPMVKSPKSKDKGRKVSRDELILDMLKKVERQKMLLLKEFGTSLPDNIYHASITSLTEPDKCDEPQKKMHRQTCLSPEVTLINMSNGEDNKISKKPKKTSVSKKCEMAVQTSTLQDAGIAEDKGVQVELKAIDSDATNELNAIKEVPIKHYPIEPIIRVITPEVEDSSSGSNNSVITGVIIDIDNKEVKVTPKKKKSALKVSKRTPTRGGISKSHSAPPSKISSPVKRFSKSLPSSCRNSPRKINIHFKKNGLDVNVDPPDDTRPTIDSSIESSVMYSSVNTQDSSIRGPYEIPVIKSKKKIKVKDTSDTSTSFASPPPLEPKRRIFIGSNTTPILELLNSSILSATERAKRDISPVSTPETPSPRTMMIPSNIPHPEKIGKVLRYGDGVDDNIKSFSKKDRDSPIYERQKDVSSGQSVYSQYSPVLSKSCTCQNPQCKLLHVQLEDIQDFALKNCPEILKKYEDLQNTCTERIASLTDLIEKVRSEQRGMELSVISPHDDISFMKIHPEMQSSMKNVQRLVENIEAIHRQLAKTLHESQNAIMQTEAINKDTDIQIVDSQIKNKFEQPVSTNVEHNIDKSTSCKTKSKPRIIKEEKVNIKLNRFKMPPHKSLATMTTVTPERNSWPPAKIPIQESNTIEELSKEILEQSKTKSNDIPAFKKISNYENKDTSLLTKSDSSKPSSSPPKSEGNNVPVQATDINIKSEKDVTFEPLLAGIPKVLPSFLTNGHRVNGRNKPPVTLHSGYYRTEIESMGHELSTIIEFDTPDTANKSHMNIKSSTAKSFAMDESYTEKSAVKKSVEVQTTKSSVTVKPSVHVAPLPIEGHVGNNKMLSFSSTSTRKSPGEVFTSKLQEVGTECDLPRRTKDEINLECRMKDKAVAFEDTGKEKVNKQLQCNTSDQETKLIHQRFDRNDNEKGKVSSTSSNSFCELSGISEITSTPSSSLLKYASSEEMETALKQLGLSWAITTLKKTREASALSSSSNSDITPLNTARRIISPNKKHIDPKIGDLLDFSDVSSISIKEASKSTEQAVLFKGRTSTPKLQNSNSNSDKSNSVATNSSGISFQERSDSLTVPNVSLIKTKPNVKQSKYL